jgi:hypothetical protein
MADLVTLAEMKTYLGDAPASSDDALLTQLLNDVEALFEAATLRAPGSYTAGEEVTEVKDGTGSPRLYLAYPIAEDGLTSVKLGSNSASPDETLSVTNKAVLVWGEGSRCISRVDGGVFGRVGQPRYVEVVYEHQDDLPEDAKLAIKEVVAAVYRNRGSEGMKSETVGSFYSYTRDDVQAATGESSHWQIAVAANTPVVIA